MADGQEFDLTTIGGTAPQLPVSTPLPPPPPPVPPGSVPVTNAPGPNRVPLSDGTSYAEIPAGISPTDPRALAFIQSAQNDLDQKYGAHAAKTNAPYTIGDKVYSATRAYPNSTAGQVMAWLDHNAGGNWMNRNIADPVNAAPLAPQWLTGPGNQPTLGGAGESAARIATNRAGWMVDLPASGYNAAKHAAGITSYDAPLVGESIRKEFGFPELPPDASYARQILEGGLSGVTSGRILQQPLATTAANIAKTAAGSTIASAGATAGSKVGGDIAAAVGGEQARELGQFAGGVGGGTAPTAAKIGAKRAAAALFRAPNSEQTFQSGAALARDQAAREVAQAQGTGLSPQELESAIQAAMAGSPGQGNLASTHSMATPLGKRFLGWYRGDPLTGGPLREDMARAAQAVQDARDYSARQLDPNLPPGGASEGSIGRAAIEGAQEAIPRLMQAQNQPYLNIRAAVGNPEVDVSNVGTDLARRTDKNQMPPPQADAYRAIVQRNIMDAAPGGSAYDPARGPIPPTGPYIPTVPWDLAQGALSSSTAQLGEGSMTAGKRIPAFVKSSLLDSMRAAAEQYGGPGMGDYFDTARQNYKVLGRRIDQMQRIGGEPVGLDEHGMPIFDETKTPSESTAASRVLLGHTQDPNRMGPLDTMSPYYRGRIAGGAISMLGNRGEGFRPDYFPQDLASIHPDVRATMLQTEPTPVPGSMSITDRLDHASQLGGNFSTKQEREGLQAMASTSLAAKKGPELAVQAGERYAPGWLANLWRLGVIGGVRGLTGGVTTPEFKAAMGRQPVGPEFWQALQRSFPVSSAVIESNKPPSLTPIPGHPGYVRVNR